MYWFKNLLELIDLVAKEIPFFLDSLSHTLLGTISDGLENSGIIDFFNEIPFLGVIITVITNWLTGPIADYTLISFMLGNGIGLVIFISLIKWIRGLS